MAYLTPLEDLIKERITTMLCTDYRSIKTLINKLDTGLTPVYATKATDVDEAVASTDQTKLYVIKDDLINWETHMDSFKETKAHIIVWKSMDVDESCEDEAEVYIPKNGSYAIRAVFYAYKEWIG